MGSLATIHVSEIDLTGIATLVLAAATAGLAFFTRQAIEQGATELDRAHRAVVIPKIDVSQNYQPWGSGAAPLGPTVDHGDLFVPVRNVGSGPALRVSAQVEFGNPEGMPSSSGIAAEAQTQLAGISHNEPWVVLAFRRVPVAGMIGFVLRLSYEDVAEQRWTTEARYSESSQTFPEVEIAPAD